MPKRGDAARSNDKAASGAWHRQERRQGRTVQHADGRLIREATEARIPGERAGSGQVRITGGYSSLFPGRDVFDGKKDVFSRR